MSKFVVVKEAPQQLGKGEIVITTPDFTEQIRACARRGGAPRNQTALNQLREILTAIQDKYGVDLDVYKIPLALYEGLEYNSEQQLNRIVTQLLKTERPGAFEGFLEYNIKNRPYGTKLIYYVGNHVETGPFFKLGLDIIEEKELDEFLGRKPKKVVGRPAISKEEMEAKAVID